MKPLYPASISEKITASTHEWSLLLFSSLFIAMSGCDVDRHNHPRLTTGKQLFEHHCASCHNKDGKGVFLKGFPANISTAKNQTEIVKYLKEGSHDSNREMPLFKDMTDDEALKIARHLLQLKRLYFNEPGHREKFLLERQHKNEP